MAMVVSAWTPREAIYASVVIGLVFTGDGDDDDDDDDG